MPDFVNLDVHRARLLETLRQQGISDERVLNVIANVPRERFVSESQWPLAYDNSALAIEWGQTISQPYIVAIMTQELELDGTQRVLEIGTGSGYQTAVLAQLSAVVYSIERIRELSFRAEVLLDQLGVRNVYFRVGDGYLGWPDEAPFERIIVTAAARTIPPSLLDQLDVGGTLVIPLGNAESQRLMAYRKRADRIDRRHLCDCRFVPLVPSET